MFRVLGHQASIVTHSVSMESTHSTLHTRGSTSVTVGGSVVNSFLAEIESHRSGRCVAASVADVPRGCLVVCLTSVVGLRIVMQVLCASPFHLQVGFSMARIWVAVKKATIDIGYGEDTNDE